MFDRLVQFVVEHVAFAGEYGAPIEHVTSFIQQFFYEREQKEGVRAPVVDDDYTNFIWTLLMEDSPIHVVFRAPKIAPEGSVDEAAPGAHADADEDDDEEDEKPKKKKRKTDVGESITVKKGAKKLTDDADVPMYEIDEEDRAVPLSDLQQKYTNLRLIVTFEVAWPILTGTYEKLSKITDPIWKVLLFIASAGPSGVAATEIGRYCNVDQRKVDALTRGAIGLHILYKRKSSIKGVTTNVLWHRAFWNVEQNRPIIEIEHERLKAHDASLSRDDLLNVPLVEKRIRKLLKERKLLAQTHIITLLGIKATSNLENRRLRAVIDNMAAKGELIKAGKSTPHGRILYLPEAAAEVGFSLDSDLARAEAGPSTRAAEPAEGADAGEEAAEVDEGVEYEHMYSHLTIPRQIIDIVKEAGTDGVGHHDIARKMDGLDHRVISRYLDHMVEHPAPDHLAADRVAFAKNRHGREEYKHWFTEEAMAARYAQTSTGDDEGDIQMRASTPPPLPPVDPKRFYDTRGQLEKYMQPFKIVEEASKKGSARYTKTAAARSASRASGSGTKKSSGTPGGGIGRPRKHPLKPGEETYYARKKREAAERAAAGLPPLPKRGPEYGGRRPKNGIKAESTPEASSAINSERGTSIPAAASEAGPSEAGPSSAPDRRQPEPQDGTANAATPESTEPKKRGRGRPRKQPVIQSDVEVMDVDTASPQPAQQPTTKRPRGRPRKVTIEVAVPAAASDYESPVSAAIVEAVDEPIPITADERPPSAGDGQANANLAEPPTPKRRGRPRKNAQPSMAPAQSAQAGTSATALAPSDDVTDRQANPSTPVGHEASPVQQVEDAPVAGPSRSIVDAGKRVADISDIEKSVQPPAKKARTDPKHRKLAPVSLAIIDKQRDILDYLTSVGGIVDFTASTFADGVRKHAEKRRPGQKLHTQDKKTLKRLLDRLIDDKKVRSQTVQLGSAQRRRQIYYLAGIDPSSEQFQTFIKELQASLAPAAAATPKPGQTRKSEAVAGPVRVFDDPEPSDPHESIQEYFRGIPKIYSTRYGALRGKYAQMRVLYTWMWQVVELEHKTATPRFDLNWLFTRMPLSTFLYLWELRDDASDEVDAFLRDAEKQRMPIRDLPANVLLFLGISTTAGPTRRLLSLLDDMAALNLIRRFETDTAGEPTPTAKAVNARYCLFSAEVPIYDFRVRSGSQTLALVDVQKVDSQAAASSFWDRQYQHAIRGGRRRTEAVTSDSFPATFRGSEAIADTIHKKTHWEDSSSLRPAQQLFVEKCLDAISDQLTREQIATIARNIYAAPYAIEEHIQSVQSSGDALPITSVVRKESRQRTSQIADKHAAVDAQGIATANAFFAGALAQSRSKQQQSGLPPNAFFASRRKQAQAVRVPTTGGPEEFFGDDYDWDSLRTGQRAPRNSLQNPKLLDLVMDAAVIIRERAERLGKSPTWAVVKKLTPSDVDVEPDRFRTTYTRIVSKPEQEIYRDRLRLAWERLWEAHGRTDLLPDPNPTSVSEFDLGLYIRFLRANVDKSVLRPPRVLDQYDDDDERDTTLPTTLLDAQARHNVKRQVKEHVPVSVSQRNAPLDRREKKLAGQPWSFVTSAGSALGASKELSVATDVSLRFAKMLVRSMEGAEEKDEDALNLLTSKAVTGYNRLRMSKLTRYVNATRDRSTSQATPVNGADAADSTATTSAIVAQQNVVFVKKWFESLKTLVPDRVLRDVGRHADAFSELVDAWECPVDLSEHDAEVAALCQMLSSGLCRFEIDSSVTWEARQAIGYSTRQAVDQDIENEVIVHPATGRRSGEAVATAVLPPSTRMTTRLLSDSEVDEAMNALKARVDSADDVIDTLTGRLAAAGPPGVASDKLFNDVKGLATSDGLEVLFETLKIDAAFVAGIRDAHVVKGTHVKDWTVESVSSAARDGDEGEGRFAPAYWLKRDGVMVDDEAWLEAVNWVRGTLTTYPGLRACDLVQRSPLSNMWSFVEIKTVLEALCESGLATARYPHDQVAPKWPDVVWHSAHFFLTYGPSSSSSSSS